MLLYLKAPGAPGGKKQKLKKMKKFAKFLLERLDCKIGPAAFLLGLSISCAVELIVLTILIFFDKASVVNMFITTALVFFFTFFMLNLLLKIIYGKK